MEKRPMTKVEAYTEWLENLANDNSHGYSQANRWGQDYDCSSGVISALEYAGIPVKSAYGATYTGNLKQALLKAGFKDVTASINLATGAGLKRGDICLNEANHVVVYIGNGKVVNIRSDDGHPEPGDQTGNEIRIQNYWNYPWDCVMRYPEVIDDDDEPVEDSDVVHPAVRRSYYHLEMGDGVATKEHPEIKPLPQVKAWQNFLICWGYEKDLGKTGADGEFGTLTMLTTKKWQKKVKDMGGDVEVNGIVDRDDWEEIIYVPTE